MSEKVLSQKDIDALFARYEEQPIQKEAAELLSLQELDTIGEIGNICMGTAATTLSKLMSQRITIGYPKVIVCNQDEVFKSFSTPYLIIEVQFKEGLSGFNVLVINEEEVAIIADIMLGGTGKLQGPINITEMELSASTEAMNQMIGASATAMSELFNLPIDISPPKTNLVEDLINASHTPLPTDKPVVVARFEITIGDIIKTTFMQITNVDTARDQAHYLLMKAGMFDESEENSVISVQEQATAVPNAVPFGGENLLSDLPNLAGALATPLDLNFSLGRSNCSVGDLAKLKPGDTITLPCQPKYVDIMVGGSVVARGELKVTGETAQIQIVQLYQSGLVVRS